MNDKYILEHFRVTVYVAPVVSSITLWNCTKYYSSCPYSHYILKLRLGITTMCRVVLVFTAAVVHTEIRVSIG